MRRGLRCCKDVVARKLLPVVARNEEGLRCCEDFVAKNVSQGTRRGCAGARISGFVARNL